MGQEIKGKLNVENIKREQGISLLREILNKNPHKTSEDLTAIELIGRIEEEFKEIESKWIYAQSILTKSQKIKCISNFKTDDEIDELMGGL